MKKTRYITDAAMVTAIAAVFLLLNNLSSGMLVSNLSFLLAIPVTIYGLKYDWKKAVIPGIASTIIGVIINLLVGLLYVLPANIMAILYSFLLKRFPQKLKLKVFFMFLGALVINVLTTVVFSKVLFGYTVVEETVEFANEIINFIAPLFGKNDFLLNVMRAVFVSIIPATIIVTSIIESLLTYLIISIIANKLLKIDVGGALVSVNLAIPSLVTYILLPLSLVSVFFINSIVDYEVFGIVQVLVTIGLNILVVLCLGYLFEALALISLYSAKYRKQYLYILSIFCIIIFPIALILLGFLDSIFKFRYKLCF